MRVVQLPTCLPSPTSELHHTSGTEAEDQQIQQDKEIHLQVPKEEEG